MSRVAVSVNAAVHSLKQSLESLALKYSPSTKRANIKPFPQTQQYTEKIRRNEVLIQHVQSWMEPGYLPEAGDILRLFECLERLVHLMEYSFSRIVWPMLIYAETYVQRTGAVRRAELFPILVVAVCLAMKMWEDYGPDLDLTAEVCGLSKKQISQLEKAFLEKLQFRLLIGEEDVEAFKAKPVRANAGCA